ncbi:MAG: 4-hydroxy-3-methylbut-2-enyl diphosphate reductase [Syntrophales bacterium]|nr:4-hydroxy-3-methylbut-2-enyl diphosphate reductase [Syntrophales bacterium]
MSVKLATTAGFCMGVKRAVDMVLDVAQHKGKETVYTYGPLIHNPQTVNLLKKRGIIPINSVEEIERVGKNALIIIRAHGISPAERRKIKAQGIRIMDATCPRVGRVQAIIKKHASLDYTVLIVGDEEHPEVNGLLGYTDGRGMVIDDPQDVDNLPDLDKICVVAQTTQNPGRYNAIAEKILSRFPNAAVFDTICDSTEKRQAEVMDLAEEMDAMIVVGGLNSANTKRLAALSERQGTPTYHIETVDDLKREWLNDVEKIGVSAGASTPNWIIDRVVDTITTYQGEASYRSGFLFRLWTEAVRTDIYSAMGASSLSITAMLLQRLPLRFAHVLLAALYVYAIHTINRFVDRRTSTIIGSFREASYRRHETVYLTTAIVSLVLALVIGLFSGKAVFLILLIMSVFGALYNTVLFPGSLRFSRLKDVPGSKNVAMAIAWATVTAIIPQTAIQFTVTPAMVVSFFFIFGLVFIRSAMSDILDIQSDKLVGKETIPVLIGRENTQKLLNAVSGLLLILLCLSFPAGWSSSLTLLLVPTVFYIWICFKVYDRKPAFSGILMEGILETSYMIAGIGSGVWVVLKLFVGR